VRSATELIRGQLPALLLFLWPTAARADSALSLADAIAIAKERRAELSVAQIELERAKLVHLAARLAWFDFHIIARANAGYEGSNIQSTASLTTRCSLAPIACASAIYDAELEGTLAVPVWTGLKNESRLAAADWREQSAEARLRLASAEILVDVAEAYWSVKRAELVRGAVGKQLEQYKEIEELVQRQVSAGVAPPFEHSRVRAETLALTAELGAVDRAIAGARTELGAALQLDDEISLVDDPREYKPTLFSRDEAERAALAAEPELAAARADDRATEYDVRAARGGYWPQLAVVGQGFGGTGSLSPGTASDRVLWGAFFGGVQLTWPIFDALETWRAVEDAELTRRRSDAELERLRHRVVAKVRARQAELAMSLGEIEPLRQAVSLARSTVEVVRRRYAAGTARLFEVLDTERELLRFEQELIGRAVIVAEADVRLRAVMGRL
jgi:outer membrane protein